MCIIVILFLLFGAHRDCLFLCYFICRHYLLILFLFVKFEISSDSNLFHFLTPAPPSHPSVDAQPLPDVPDGGREENPHRRQQQVPPLRPEHRRDNCARPAPSRVYDEVANAELVLLFTCGSVHP